MRLSYEKWTQHKTRSRWRLKRLHAAAPQNLVVIILVKAEIEIFQIVAWPHFGHIIKASHGFKGGSLSQ